MTDEVRAKNIEIIRADTPEQLLERFVYYCQHYNPVDDDQCERYEMVKAEVIRRMTGQ